MVGSGKGAEEGLDMEITALCEYKMPLEPSICPVT